MVRRRRLCASSRRCPVIVEAPARYCADHAHEGERSPRPSAHRRGYDGEWRTRRAVFLRDAAPRDASGAILCENCGKAHHEIEPGRYVAADGHPVEVDHIDGRGPSGDNRDRNLQTLCRRCHQRKTALQNRTGGTHQ